jgi:hypothetical protein
MKKEYKIGLNYAVLYFEVFYILFIIWQIIQGLYTEAAIISVAAVLIIGYLQGFRPYKYTVDRKSLIIHKRIGKDVELNLMSCETITDPIPKLTRFIVNPHGVEIYTEGKKRYMLVPKKRLEFVQSVVTANKRIHVSVKDYIENHRAFEKRERKARKKEKREENKA